MLKVGRPSLASWRQAVGQGVGEEVGGQKAGCQKAAAKKSAKKKAAAKGRRG
jgi:hypothetical protein